MDDDFTFPTVVAGPDGGPRHDRGAALRGGKLPPRPPDAAAPAGAPSSSSLWPFAAPAAAVVGALAAPTVKEEEEGPAPASGRGDAQESGEEALVAAGMEKMDVLWEDAAATTTAPASRRSGGGRAEPPARRADAGEAARAAAADAERMDLLWESFNDDLTPLRRAAAGDHRPRRLDADSRYPCHPLSDGETEETSTSASSPGRRRYGCAPTMLRASSRAGGAAQFCGTGGRSSPRRRRGRGAAAGWTLLLRLFRRLFAVDNTAPPRPRHAAIYVP